VLKSYIINDYVDYSERSIKRLTIMDFDILVCSIVVVSKIDNRQQINENVWQAVDYALCGVLNVLDCFN